MGEYPPFYLNLTLPYLTLFPIEYGYDFTILKSCLKCIDR